MLLSESYKKRIQELAGVISEAVTDVERIEAFAASDTKVPFNVDLMKAAIKQGREVGVLFQTNNEKHKMPLAKYRIIYPVVLGITKAGNMAVRAFHKLGQSESEAQKTGVRSAEVENTWRLFKTENIKGMWFTGNFFRGPLEAYNPNDKDLVSIHAAANFNTIKRYQDKLFKDKAEKEAKIKKVGNEDKSEESAK